MDGCGLRSGAGVRLVFVAFGAGADIGWRFFHDGETEGAREDCQKEFEGNLILRQGPHWFASCGECAFKIEFRRVSRG